MTRRATHTQSLAQSVIVHVVFFRFGDDATVSYTHLRAHETIGVFAAAHSRDVTYPDVYWQEMPLQGPESPYATWPEIRELYLVTEGGISDATGDTEIDPTALGAFTDQSSAEAFANEHHNSNVVVRKVALDTELPIPAWITGDALKY